ncbi:hypothetical protein [Variovorax sp. PBL-H6]|uniref:hypothetical protein n=1 Tax=Variovorax sp. PBL-H6 TaxID=434009 RepID=UPI0013A58652|nr:hypothetical protein [Variovorax sp. PBL-H6]
MLAEAGSEQDSLHFMQEISRCYPFFPAVAEQPIANATSHGTGAGTQCATS